MIQLYTWGTPNGQKASIMLEACALPYTVHAVDINKGEQRALQERGINPNGRIPAIVDETPDGPITVFESGAILVYLAEKTGTLLGSTPQQRADALAWTFWQVGGLGPMLGQLGHFSRAAPEKIPYAIERYRTESNRLFGVLDTRLADREYVAGPLTIGDVACLPWAEGAMRMLGGDDPDIRGRYPAMAAWIARLLARPDFVAGLAVPKPA